MDSFTKEDIKNSVEYQCRLSNIKRILLVYLVVVIVTSLIPVIIFLKNNAEYLTVVLLTWFVSVLVIGLIFLSFIIYCIKKCRYLINNYRSFNYYEVILDSPSTSHSYRTSIYYSVTINILSLEE